MLTLTLTADDARTLAAILEYAQAELASHAQWLERVQQRGPNATAYLREHASFAADIRERIDVGGDDDAPECDCSCRLMMSNPSEWCSSCTARERLMKAR